MYCRLVRGRGKANRNYLQLYVFDDGCFLCVWVFFNVYVFGCSLFWGFACFFVLVKEDFEKHLKISLMNIL